ncbi:SH3 domain-containing protein [bacterium]|nr:SH3 domain-containing protein [bacterium]
MEKNIFETEAESAHTEVAKLSPRVQLSQAKLKVLALGLVTGALIFFTLFSKSTNSGSASSQNDPNLVVGFTDSSPTNPAPTTEPVIKELEAPVVNNLNSTDSAPSPTKAHPENLTPPDNSSEFIPIYQVSLLRKELENEIASLKQALSAKDQQLNALKATTIVPGDPASEIRRREDALLNLNTKFQELKNKYDLEMQSSKAIKQALADMQSGSANYTKEIAQLKTELRNSRDEISRLLLEIREKGTSEKELSLHKQQLLDAHKDIRDLKASLEASKTLTTNNSYLRAEIAKAEKELSDLRIKSSEYDKYKPVLETALERIKTLSKENAEFNLKITELSKNSTEKSHALETTTKELADLKIKATTSEKNLQELIAKSDTSNTELEKLRAELATLRPRAEQADKLESDLVNTRNELLLKQTELSALTETASPNRKSDTRVNARAQTADVQPQIVAADVALVEIIAEKANLRSGPGEEHSPVMQLQKGARLTVEAIQGEWIRVLTPTGGRAYVRKDVTRNVGANSPTPAARGMRGDDNFNILANEAKSDSNNDDPEVEDAFKTLKNSFQKDN